MNNLVFQNSTCALPKDIPNLGIMKPELSQKLMEEICLNKDVFNWYVSQIKIDKIWLNFLFKFDLIFKLDWSYGLSKYK